MLWVYMSKDELTEAAETVFAEQGYEAATMDMIAARAGVSKKTIYQLHGSKEALFTAIIRKAQQRFESLGPEEADGSDPAAALSAYLIAMADFIFAPRQLAIVRLIIAAGTRAPEIGAAFSRVALDKGPNRLVGCIERCRLPVEDAKTAAAMLFGMAIGEFQLKTLISDSNRPDDATLATAIKTAVAAFLRAYPPAG